MKRSLEQLLAHFCAPALAGIKPANLVSCQRKLYPGLPDAVQRYNNSLNKSGIYFDIIYECRAYYLLLVYRHKVLAKAVAAPAVQEILTAYAYPQTKDLQPLLSHLKARFAAKDGFPHEIGLFLGYPLDDFLGYYQNHGKDYLLNGYWKVYADTNAAKSIFDRYDICSRALAQKVDSGRKIEQLFNIKVNN